MASTSNVVYGSGDTCLTLSPFDSYKQFTLYDDWRNDNRKPLDLSNGQHIYLVFKSRKQEIRIPEFDTTNTSYTVDKVNGQVLFKITQKNAVDILSMNDNLFYVTRMYQITDSTGTIKSYSDEEVMFTGRWRSSSDESAAVATTAQVKQLSELLSERNETIKQLQQANAALIAQNVDYATQIDDLNKANAMLEQEITDLETQLSEYVGGVEYTGEVIGEGTYTNIISQRQYTEEELKSALESLEYKVVE